MNGGMVENSNRIKDENGRLFLEEAEVRRISKEYYEELYNVDTQGQVTVPMYGFHGVQRGNSFGGEQIRRMMVEVRGGKLKNGKAEGKDEVTEEINIGGCSECKRWKKGRRIFYYEKNNKYGKLFRKFGK